MALNSQTSHKTTFAVYNHQKQFVSTTQKFPALVAGYGAGKTVAFCLKAIAEAGRNAGKVILLAEPTYPMVRDVLRPTLEMVLRELNFSFDYKATEMRYRISWKGGWADIILRSAENYIRWAGLNLAGFGIDEAALLKDDSAWKMGLGRLRDGNHLTAWTTTTPEGFNWHYRYWEEEPKSNYHIYRGISTDNKHLPKEFIDTLLENYDERLVRAYLYGEYVNLQHGTTYYSFSREENVVDEREAKYNPHLPLHIGLDFNVDPMCAVLFQIHPSRPKVHVFDEVVIRHSGNENELMTQRMARTIKEKYPNNKYICYPDPSGKARGTSSKMSDHQLLAKNGFRIKAKKAAPSIIDSVNAVNNLLKDNCIISKKCKGLIKDLEQTVNKDGTREIDKSDKERTHLTDGFRYAIDLEFPVRRPKVRQI